MSVRKIVVASIMLVIILTTMGSSRTSVPGPWKRRSQAVRERKTSVLRACRVPNPRTIERRAASENPLRATTINDFVKLGTALGGMPTIVERLPTQPSFDGGLGTLLFRSRTPSLRGFPGPGTDVRDERR